MKTENVLYTDGHDVTVTDSVLQVKKKWYSLNGITRHGFSIIQPVRLPCFFMLGMGTLLTVTGTVAVVDTSLMGANVLSMDLNDLLVFIGIGCLVVGVLLMYAMGERYAVSITTADGDKNVVVSRRKDYIIQIVHALNNAFFARIHSEPGQKRTREFIVSGR
jgi:hypothetical protein